MNSEEAAHQLNEMLRVGTPYATLFSVGHTPDKLILYLDSKISKKMFIKQFKLEETYEGFPLEIIKMGWPKIGRN